MELTYAAVIMNDLVDILGISLCAYTLDLEDQKEVIEELMYGYMQASPPLYDYLDTLHEAIKQLRKRYRRDMVIALVEAHAESFRKGDLKSFKAAINSLTASPVNKPAA
jgi:hypothetical protein